MNKKLNLMSLTSLVISSMLGAGIFSLPQNMAYVASPIALIIGWIITGIGILFLATSMLLLHKLKPHLQGGIFSYARDGFGELIGFCSAWGYWLCAVIANVSYLVIVFASLSFFTDNNKHIIFGNGNTWQALLSSSILLWLIHILLLQGTQTAAVINLITTICKLLPLSIFMIFAIILFRYKIFITDLIGLDLALPIITQIKNTMLITLWVFIGVEGAIILSSRAKKQEDIQKATFLAIIIALCIYLLTTVLSLGILPRSALSHMRNPSMAGLMQLFIGDIGYIFIILGLIISVCGAYLSWTIMAAEVPLIAAQHKMFPPILAQQNKKQIPIYSLWLTNISMQIFLILIWLTHIDYNYLLTLASEMILIPYFLVGAYLFKISLKDKNFNIKNFFVGTGSCFYGLWLLYASGITHLLLSLILYLPGLLLIIITKMYNNNMLIFSNKEKILFIILFLGSILSLIYLVI
ncbi:basic amino acid/polyamine antiporter [Enterobacteriaceae endosymbiont of Macroplea appendiculata]|uniref:basic amino acid/polyamine antiporter n=1 Tax=Enterobacteriaceae endosymbiont of Macroplea appendiculata TaxID=2675790 RepID=UPI0014495B33|nr:basic amino acid/polyamine antiporter [Enterobacteriaceae endosymbiont of Macroplea appendiculata]QJC30991.1 amino acid permease [Enterobacteriaceae endosymbiont of Macroplea appendiculata]